MTDHQRLAEALIELREAAAGHPLRDRLVAAMIGGTDADLPLLLAHAGVEAQCHTPCPRCGCTERVVDFLREIEDRVLDQLLDEQQAAP